MSPSGEFTGSCAMLIYVTLMAAASILIHETNQAMAPQLSAFYTFSFCLFVYASVTPSLFKKMSLIKQNLPTIVILNITTAICWILTFYALKSISSELFLFTYLCAMPITSSFIYRRNLFKALLYLLGIIFLTFTYQHGDPMVGVTLAFIGGASGAIYSIYAKKVIMHFTTLEILAFRFYLLVLLTFIMTLQLHALTLAPLHDYARFAVLSLFTVIIPLIFFQIGIKYLPVSKALAYLPLAPLLCYGFNLAMGTATFHPLQFSIILFITTTILFPGQIFLRRGGK